MDISTSTQPMVRSPGKSAHAVGQMAKAAVAEARAAGMDLPKNAQGAAASAIAKGADPASIFAAITAEDPVETPGDVAPDAPIDTGDETAVSETAEAGYSAASDVVAPAATDDETALALLEEFNATDEAPAD